MTADVSRARLRAIPTGNGRAQSSGSRPRLTDGTTAPALDAGYTEVEYLFSGVGCMYSGAATGPATVVSDGHRYVTRLLARYPSNRDRFSGRVVVEPFNTSNGPDTDALWARIAPLLQSEGDGWIGVSERASSVKHLLSYDAVRYADLAIATNDLAWDVLRQVGMFVRTAGDRAPLAGLAVEYLYLAGYSQSAADTATFAMSFHDDTRLPDGRPVFDGYFPAAHSASLTPLQSGTRERPSFEYAPMRPPAVPVIDVEMQTDVEGFTTTLSSGREYTSRSGASVRRADSDGPVDRYRLYEISGAPHLTSMPGCDGNGSSFPAEAFLRAGMARLYRWAERGIVPPTAPRITLTVLDDVAVAAVDECGNALDGVRSPHLDVPLSRYEVHAAPGPRCALAGRETPLSARELLARYGDVESYLKRFTERLDASIRDGFLLGLDQPRIVAVQTDKARQAFAARQHR